MTDLLAADGTQAPLNERALRARPASVVQPLDRRAEKSGGRDRHPQGAEDAGASGGRRGAGQRRGGSTIRSGSAGARQVGVRRRGRPRGGGLIHVAVACVALDRGAASPGRSRCAADGADRRRHAPPRCMRSRCAPSRSRSAGRGRCWARRPTTCDRRRCALLAHACRPRQADRDRAGGHRPELKRVATRAVRSPAPPVFRNVTGNAARSVRRASRRRPMPRRRRPRRPPSHPRGSVPRRCSRRSSRAMPRGADDPSDGANFRADAAAGPGVRHALQRLSLAGRRPPDGPGSLRHRWEARSSGTARRDRDAERGDRVRLRVVEHGDHHERHPSPDCSSRIRRSGSS